MGSVIGGDGKFGVQQAGRIQELRFAQTLANELQAGDGMGLSLCGHRDRYGQRGISGEVDTHGIL